MSYNHICHEDRLFPAEGVQRSIARELYAEVAQLPIISPHGHTEASWFSENKNFDSVSDLLVTPDHYLLRMFYSQGLDLSLFGLSKKDSDDKPSDQEVWHHFAKNFYLFRGTPSWLWLNHVFYNIFGLNKLLSLDTADFYFDKITAQLKTEAFKPRALLSQFSIEVLATTDHAMDDLLSHQKLVGAKCRVLPTFRPDRLTNPEHPQHSLEMQRLKADKRYDIQSLKGFLTALKDRRDYFKSHGATATDHGHPDAFTCELSDGEAESLYQKILSGNIEAQTAKLFRGYMLFKMAEFSIEDGLVMQIHTGVYRNHNPWLYENYGADKGADMPTRSEFIHNLKPLLDRFGNNKSLNIILFTLDESTYSRELAPLAGHYPSIKLGPPWWFHDSPEGMRRFREQTLETAGFYNQVGFIDDTRAFFSIPARHDVARRMDCNILSRWVSEHRITFDEAVDTLKEITYSLPKRSFHL